VIGGIAGAIASALVIAGAVAFVDWAPREGALRNIFFIGTVIGFAVGGFLAPASTWLFLRRVPLWRASTETAFLASIATTTAALSGLGLVVSSVIGGGAALLAAARLHFAFRKRAPVAEVSEQTESTL
jgi:MFS family permease